jgi:protoporphyrinogen oxidase
MSGRSEAAEVRPKTAIVIGAGPAGLTAAHELIARAGISPTVLEKSDILGGISRTVNYQGNRIDIGGHRFFSKNDSVMKWWLDKLPLECSLEAPACPGEPGLAPAAPKDQVMLMRTRKSRVLFLRRFFDYPISLSLDTLRKLGLARSVRIALSYLKSALSPKGLEKTLEQFFINRFGRELYNTFFKSYTEKVWGVPCSRISAEWGAQRTKGLSVWSTLLHALRKVAGCEAGDLAQKGTETSLIERFLYPRFGPGQMWEEVARRIRAMGGEIRMESRVTRLITDGWRIRAVEVADTKTGSTRVIAGDYFFSTAPIRELMRSLDAAPPENVLEVSDGLVYRDFLTVGLLVPSLRIRNGAAQDGGLIPDNWIYVQEPDVLLGRIQIFNNWSPFMVSDPSNVWLGLEYFCDESDEIWNLSDERMTALAIEELGRIGFIEAGDVIDSTVLRMEKAYPAYFATYDRFAEIRKYVDNYENLFLIGRNGMHRYNNQDHSMLTAMLAVDHIIAGKTGKDDLWNVNSESDYHEERGKPR